MAKMLVLHVVFTEKRYQSSSEAWSKNGNIRCRPLTLLGGNMGDGYQNVDGAENIIARKSIFFSQKPGQKTSSYKSNFWIGLSATASHRGLPSVIIER